MAACSSMSETSYGKQKETKMCSPDNLNIILNQIFPRKLKFQSTRSSEVLGFHNLEKHITSILAEVDSVKPEMISSLESKPETSSGRQKKLKSSYLKGIFGDKKVDPRDSDKNSDFEIEHRDGRLGPWQVALQPHPLDTAPGDPSSVIGNMNFQSVKANCCVYKGKWMYEAVLGSSGLMQIGWCTASCKFTREEGVGDTPESYAFDGYRETKWNSRENSKYGETWSANDVVSCLIDLDNRTVSFLLNGKDLGVAFHRIPTGPGVAYFPAFSVAYKEVLHVNFGAHVMKYPVPGYQPIQGPPENKDNVDSLVKSLASLVDIKRKQTTLSSSLDPVTECVIASHIFSKLSPMLMENYNIESSFISFLYNLPHPILHKMLCYVWNFMEESAAQTCISYLLSTVTRHFRTAKIPVDFGPQKKYLAFVLGLVRHTRTKIHLLDCSLSEKKDELPYLFHIKQPAQNCGVLDSLSPKQLKERMTAVEDIQRDILKAFLDTDDKENVKLCRSFSEKFRKLIQCYVSATNREQSALCPPLVMHSFMQRLVDIIRLQWDIMTVSKTNYVPSSEGFVPPEIFYSGLMNFPDTQRAGGLKSHLLQEHRELLEKEGVSVTIGSRSSSHSESWRDDHRAFLQLLDNNPGTSLSNLVSSDDESEMESYNNPVMRLARALLQQSSKLTSSGGTPSVSRKKGAIDDDLLLPTQMYLLELTDGCIMIYAQSIHHQMDKICSTRSKLNDFTKSLKETETKLEKCNDPQFEEIRSSLEQSKQLLQKHVTELGRSMEWLKASTYAPESQHNLWWLHQVCLKTVKRMSEKRALFAFIPEYYITCTTRIFKGLREYFYPTQPFDILPNLSSVLKQFSLFLSHHHCDSRIINTDVKTLLATTLASFVTHPLQVQAIEALSEEERKKLMKSMLNPYDEDKPWTSMGHRILAGMWRGKGFALSYTHPPYVAKVKRLLNRQKDPYVSLPLLNLLSEIMIENKELSSDFVHSIINHLNWCFSEFIGQMQEVHIQGTKAGSGSTLLSALDAQSLRQVRIVDMLFEISVSLLRVLELTVCLAPDIYLDWDKRDKAEVLVASLTRVINQILNRVTKKSNIFDKVVSSKHPGLRSVVHYPLLVAITGVLVSLLKEHENPVWNNRASSSLLKDTGFNKEAIDFLFQDHPPLPTNVSDAASTSSSSSSQASAYRMAKTEGFSLKHREEVSETEYKEATEVMEKIHKWVEELESEEPMDEESLCTICYANEISVVFNPCKHTSCRSCISHQLMNNKECFFCKATVEGFSNIVEKTN